MKKLYQYWKFGTKPWMNGYFIHPMVKKGSNCPVIYPRFWLTFLKLTTCRMRKMFYCLLPVMALAACSGNKKPEGSCTVGNTLLTVWCNNSDCTGTCILYEDGKKIGAITNEKPYNRRELSTYECKCE